MVILGVIGVIRVSDANLVAPHTSLNKCENIQRERLRKII
jgi:hypothetical protein